MRDRDLHAFSLPVRTHDSALGEDRAKREHRRVRRKDDEAPSRIRQVEPAIERDLERRLELEPVPGEAAVDEPQTELGCALAGRDHPVDMGEERLEVDVPDPRHVPAVGDRVVQRDDERRRDTRLERPQCLVRAGGILDEEHNEVLRPGGDALEAPERGAEALEACPDPLERGVECDRERRRSGGVVDVVEPRQTELDR